MKQRTELEEMQSIVQLVQNAVSQGLNAGALGGDLVYVNKATEASIALSGIVAKYKEQQEKIKEVVELTDKIKQKDQELKRINDKLSSLQDIKLELEKQIGMKGKAQKN